MAEAQYDPNDPFASPRQPIATARNTFIPPWYTPHDSPETIVVKHPDGRDMPFTVRDVAPERRWAIQPDGTLMDPRDFEEKYRQWLNGQWEWKQPSEKPMDTHFLSKPSPLGFVSKRVDPTRPERLAPLPGLRPVRVKRAADPTPIVDEGIVAAGSGWEQAPSKDEGAEATTATEATEATPAKPPVPSIPCDVCGKEFKGNRGMLFHKRQKHGPVVVAGEA